MSQLTAKELQIARRMFNSHPIEAIALALHHRHQPATIRAAVERSRKESRERYRANYLRKSFIEYSSSVSIPAKISEDRKSRERLHHTNLTALICGDPLPGYSALDRRRAP